MQSNDFDHDRWSQLQHLRSVNVSLPRSHHSLPALLQKPRRAYPTELASFHTPEYINFLATATPWNQHELKDESQQYNINDDCPVFDGLYDFIRLYAGASIEAANKINSGMCDIAINWSGGLHHAKKGEASGLPGGLLVM